MSNTITNVNKQAFPNPLIDGKIADLHKSCPKAPGGKGLSDCCQICHLGDAPRKITLEYMNDKQRDEAIVSCSLVAQHIFPGWGPQECTDDKIADLFVEKTKDLVADASKRKNQVSLAGTSKEAEKVALQALSGGFWYANDYFIALKTLKQKPRLDFFQKKNAFYHGHPPEGFNHVADNSGFSETGKMVSGYVNTLSGVQGVVSMRRSLSFIDCQELIEIAFYQTTLEVLGAARFNNHFRSDGPNALRLDADTRITPLQPLLAMRMTQKGTLGKRPVEKGETLYFMNVPAYRNKHTEGDAAGYHAVCMETKPSQRFLAFGLPPEGVAEGEIVDIFVNAFNETPLQSKEMYTEDLVKRISASFDESMLPPGMTKEVFRRKVHAITLTKEQYLRAEATYPDQVGYSKLRAVKLDSSKIRELLLK